MLMLLFRVEDERWAIAAADVQDVIPRVDLQKVPHSHPMIAGLLNYHGDMLPVIDISTVIAGQPAAEILSTRIALVTLGALRIGVIVAHAGETARLVESVTLPTHSTYVQGAFKTVQGDVVQRLAIAPLFAQLFEQMDGLDSSRSDSSRSDNKASDDRRSAPHRSAPDQSDLSLPLSGVS